MFYVQFETTLNVTKLDLYLRFMWFFIQRVPKRTQTIENDLLLEFQWPSTKLNVKSAKYLQGAYIKY